MVPQATPLDPLVHSHLQHLRVERRLAARSLALYGDALQRLQSFAASSAAPKRKPISEVFEEIRKGVPDEEWDKLPVDGAEQHAQYIYGLPKRPVS